MAFLDTIFSPFLLLSPLFAIIILAALISIFMVLVYKWMTDQKLMRELKTEIKETQKKMKEAKDNPKKVMELQKTAMEANMKYMMQSFKPTIVTFIPIILIFAWMNSHMGYYPLLEDQQFNVTAAFAEGTSGNITLVDVPTDITTLSNEVQSILEKRASWTLVGKVGDYTLSYRYENVTVKHPIKITNGERVYAKPVLTQRDLGLKNSKLQSITVSNVKILPFKDVPVVASIPWIGGFGWLGTYILFSLIFSIGFRKVLKVH